MLPAQSQPSEGGVPPKPVCKCISMHLNRSPTSWPTSERNRDSKSRIFLMPVSVKINPQRASKPPVYTFCTMGKHTLLASYRHSAVPAGSCASETTLDRVSIRNSLKNNPIIAYSNPFVPRTLLKKTRFLRVTIHFWPYYTSLPPRFPASDFQMRSQRTRKPK